MPIFQVLFLAHLCSHRATALSSWDRDLVAYKVKHIYYPVLHQKKFAILCFELGSAKDGTRQDETFKNEQRK